MVAFRQSPQRKSQASRGCWGNAMYHLMLGDELSSAEAHRTGFVPEIVPAGQQMERAMEPARIIAGNAPPGTRVTKSGTQAQ
jgi:enoyl-CoA hydratase/carnithine racemase